ncbi:MAG: hypothetical protein QW332_06030 [Thermoproteota archaeon]
MQSIDVLKSLEKLRRNGKIIGYEYSEKGVVLLVSDSFSDDEIRSLDLNIVKIIRMKGKLEALAE